MSSEGPGATLSIYDTKSPIQLARQSLYKKKGSAIFVLRREGQLILPDGINVEVNGPVVTASDQPPPHRVRRGQAQVLCTPSTNQLSRIFSLN